MNQPSSNYFNFRLKDKQYRIHYLDWGDSGRPALFCAHGLTRNGRDFDFLARELSKEFRVIAVDYPGRGLSDWLDNKIDYTIPNYVEVSLALVDELKLSTVDWLGTSMGGLIGMCVAAFYPQRLNRLIINDVGPEIPEAAKKRISDYLSLSLEFKNLTDFEQHLRLIYAPFGELNDQQWKHLVTYSHYIDQYGKILANYDPGIVVPFKQNIPDDTDMWEIWKNISNRIYLLHGENSDILSPSIIEKMKQLQTGLISKSVKNTGHAPALMDKAQIELIEHCLNTKRDD